MASDDKSAKKRFKKAQKQPSVSKKVKLTDEEKAKQEAKKAKEAEKLKAEKKRNAEIAAKLAQATKRIFAQNHEQSSPNPHQSTEIHLDLECNNIHTLSLPAFREQQSSTTSETAMTPSKKQVAAKRKQKNPQTHKSPPSQIQLHQGSGRHYYEGNSSHPLSMPAFKKQLSPSTPDPAPTPNKKEAVNREQQPQADHSSSHQPSDHELSDHQENDNTDLPPSPTAADSVTSRKKEKGKIKNKTAQQPTTSLSTPTTCSNKSTKKQITHVLSDDEDDCDENAVITTS